MGVPSEILVTILVCAASGLVASILAAPPGLATALLYGGLGAALLLPVPIGPGLGGGVLCGYLFGTLLSRSVTHAMDDTLAGVRVPPAALPSFVRVQALMLLVVLAAVFAWGFGRPPRLAGMTADNASWILCLLLAWAAAAPPRRVRAVARANEEARQILLLWCRGAGVAAVAALLGVLAVALAEPRGRGAWPFLIPVVLGLFTVPSCLVRMDDSAPGPDVAAAPLEARRWRAACIGLGVGAWGLALPLPLAGPAVLAARDLLPELDRRYGAICAIAARTAFLVPAWLRVVGSEAVFPALPLYAPANWSLPYRLPALGAGMLFATLVCALLTPRMADRLSGLWRALGRVRQRRAVLALCAVVSMSCSGPRGLLLFAVACGLGVLCAQRSIPVRYRMTALLAPAAVQASFGSVTALLLR